MNKVYIVLFENGNLQLWTTKVNRHDFWKNVRIFEAPDYLSLISVCRWIGNNYNHSEIKECST